MARSGAITLSDVRETSLTVVCALCNRGGVYSVRRLEAKHGGAGLPDLLAFLSKDCPKRSSTSELDRCAPKFEWPNGPPSGR